VAQKPWLGTSWYGGEEEREEACAVALFSSLLGESFVL